MLQGNMKNKEERIHPTQKPVALYSWLLKNYGKEGDKIFDPFLGSGSSRIAAYKMGFDFVGCEIDEEYFRLSEERFQKECKGVEVMKDVKLNELAKKAYENAKAKGFHDEKHTDGHCLM